MSEALDIQINVDRSAPNVAIAINDTWREVQLSVERGGAYYLPYEGPTHVTPTLYWGQRLETYGRAMPDDVVIDAIPFTETSNPQGGRTIVIG